MRRPVSVSSLGFLFAIAVAGCAPSTGGKTRDIREDSILIPPDALFPQDVETETSVETTPDSGASETSVPDTTPDVTVAPDTTPDATVATDTSVPTDATSPADTSACPQGQGCNDNDPCTVNDHCEGGVCVGGGATCDDHVSCTVDSCNGGICGHAIQPGACIIGGVCYSADQPNPQDACERCTPAASTTGWTEVAGCGLGVPCIYHADCVPERMCAQWVSTGQKVCSDPCSGAADCPSGQICSKLPGSAQIGFCENAPAGAAYGQPCAQDSDCASGLCDGICVPLCLDETHCNFAGTTCHGVGSPSQGTISAACSPDPVGSIPLGQPCSPDGGNTIDSAYCASGHCDFMIYLNTLGEQVPPCVPLCKSELDCAPAQECNFVIRATATNPNVVPYDAAYDERTYDVLTGCYNPGQFGPRAVGQTCTAASQCGSNKCLPVDPENPGTQYCTSFCELDAECPSDMECGMGVLNLVSVWLIAVSEDYDAQAATYVRICKYPRD